MKRPKLERIGLGPVFVYESITSARRWQGYALRSLFLLFLLAALMAMWKNASLPANPSIGAMASLGESFYLGVAGTQLALVTLAAPAATAGAICLDRARGTLTHLLVTDLSNVEIVLGKLAARLVPVLGLLACTLPMMELLTLIGGVNPQALWWGFVVSVAVAVLGCSLAMLLSLWVGKTHEALLGTYAVWILWLLARYMIGPISWAFRLPEVMPPQTADPFFLILAPYWSPKSVDSSDYLWFLAVTCSISAFLIAVATLRIRAVCTRETVRKPSRALAAVQNQSIWKLLSRAIPWLSPSLDRNPVLWREWNRGRPSRWASVVIALYVILAIFFSVSVVSAQGGRAAVFVNGFQVAIGLLLLSVTAATSLAEERVCGSLDLLMSTSLSTREILLGKWLGVYRTVPLLAILPTAVVGVLAYENDASPAWAGAMCVYVLCAGAAITSLGLAMATRFSRLGPAVVTTVSLYVLVTVGWFFLMFGMFRGSGERPALLSPFMLAAAVTFEVLGLSGPRHSGETIMMPVIAAWFALEFLVWTLGSFDRRLGRIPDGTTRLLRRSTTIRILNAIYLSLMVVVGFLTTGRYLFAAAAAFQFTLGTFLAIAAAASSPTGVGAFRGSGWLIDPPGGRIIVIKWLTALQLTVPGMIFAWFMVMIQVNTHSELWWEIPIMIGYMLSTGAVAASLGVALSAWSRRRGWPVIWAIVVWSLVTAASLSLSAAAPSEPLWDGLCMISPFHGVWTLVSAIATRTGGRFDLMRWAIAWSVVYSLAAAGLLLAARAWQRPPQLAHCSSEQHTGAIRHS